MTWCVLGVIAWVCGSKCPRGAVNRAGRWVSVTATSEFPDEADDLGHRRVFKVPGCQVPSKIHWIRISGVLGPIAAPLLPAGGSPSWLTLSGKGSSAILERWRAPECKVIVLEPENSQGSESERMYERVTKEGWVCWRERTSVDGHGGVHHFHHSSTCLSWSRSGLLGAGAVSYSPLCPQCLHGA